MVIQKMTDEAAENTKAVLVVLGLKSLRPDWYKETIISKRVVQ